MSKAIGKKNAAYYTWGDNCSSWVLNDTAVLSVKQEQIPAGAREQLHYHQHASQFFFVLKGVATFYVDDEMMEVKEQEGISVTNGRKHFVVNNSDEPIEFLVISQPTTLNDRINI
ncbi:MAG: cupin domain-containing protein [Bacteroidota bacterium]